MEWQQIDARLRRHGFRVYARKKDARALWEKDGKLYTVTEALVKIKRDMMQLQTSKSGV